MDPASLVALSMAVAKISPEVIAEAARGVSRAVYEPKLRAMGLGADQIESMASSTELSEALGKINALLASSDPLDIRNSIQGDKGRSVSDEDRSAAEARTRQYLLDRKEVILRRLEEVAQAEYETFPQADENDVAEQEEGTLAPPGAVDYGAQLESVRSQREAAVAEEIAALTRKQSELDLLERKMNLWRAWFARESIATLLGATLLFVLTVAFLAAMFMKVEISTLMSNAFLLILGYFFGHAVGQRENS